MKPLAVFIFIALISLIASATSIPLKGWVYERAIMDSKAYSLTTAAQSFELSVNNQKITPAEAKGIKNSTNADLKKWWTSKSDLLALLGTKDHRLSSAQVQHDDQSSTWIVRATYRDSANELIDYVEVTQFVETSKLSIVLTSSKSIPLKDSEIKITLLKIKEQLR